MSRHEGGRLTLDHEKQFQFFERRAALATPETSHAATSFSATDEAEHRHLSEVSEALHLLNLDESSVVLDIGCGGARWGRTVLTEMNQPVACYVGVDFSPKLIALAKDRNLPSSHFYVMAADKLKATMLDQHGPYTHCIVTALCLYMNDQSVTDMLASIAQHLLSGGTFYWREPVSLTGRRLTLIDEFSEKIGDMYNAAYRTSEEYLSLLGSAGAFELVSTSFLRDTTFQRHATTRHQYFVAQRL
jgi:SAM-dependent methyltransferase